MSIAQTVVSAILNKNTVKRLGHDKALVICGNNGETTNGDVIDGLVERSVSRELLKKRCIGASIIFGDAVFVAVNINGDIKVIRGVDCDREFPFTIHESNIHI